LTEWHTMEAEPSWSCDGESVYFWSDHTGRPEIWKLRVTGGEPQQITTDGGWIARESADGKLLYYTKQPSSPLFAKALAGGAERQVLKWIHQRSFVVTADGIYYMGRWDAGDHTAPLRFFEFRSSRDWLIRKIDANPAMALAISPDRRTILLPVFDPSDGNPSSDLMLVENFR
jgi:WD40 repeat protein